MAKHYLDQIIQRKMTEVKLLKDTFNHSRPAIHPAPKNDLFARALRTKPIAVIAEIKRRSPSRGHLNLIENPVELALEYCKGGASAISVLTDNEGFGGSLLDLQHIANAVAEKFPRVPILRKDFIVDTVQLKESAHAGAHCVLLIARVLKDKLADFIDEATRLGLETLTEVHDEKDIAIANQARAPIVGINHRDLSSFTIDLTISNRLRPLLHKTCLSVAESGIQSAQHADHMQQLGYDAILVGEALVTAKNPAAVIRQMRGGA